MTKKHFVAAAKIVRTYPHHAPSLRTAAKAIENSFVQFFKSESSRFDEARFRAACAPQDSES